VKLGLEVDWVGERADELADRLAPYPFDYLLGSVHWLDGVHGVDGAVGGGAWEKWSEDEVWRRYVEALSAAAASGCFDVLSHPDLAKINGARGSDAHYSQLAAAVDNAAVALEISSAGLRKPIGELYPDPRLLELSDAPVTLASDAHRPAHVGEDFGLVLELARTSGRETVSVFNGRTRRQEPLGERVPVGSGFDAHAFEDGVPLVLGGVRIDHPRGLAGHSDGDVLAHALTDAVLGAAGLEDIGALFSSDDPALAGADSVDLLARAWGRVAAGGWELANADVVLIGEEPRLAPHRDAMRERLAGALGVTPELVAVRATTTDGLGFTGRREGLAAQAVALLRR
jgi:2-C-methyl-D-erythritol 2,4-cyclodiphosphate synthase